jgi:hypothetical protein
MIENARSTLAPTKLPKLLTRACGGCVNRFAGVVFSHAKRISFPDQPTLLF